MRVFLSRRRGTALRQRITGNIGENGGQSPTAGVGHYNSWVWLAACRRDARCVRHERFRSVDDVWQAVLHGCGLGVPRRRDGAGGGAARGRDEALAAMLEAMASRIEGIADGLERH